MEEKEIWMKKLKEKLDDYSEPTPASGWEQLEKDLASTPEKRIYPYRKWIMSAAAVILLALITSVSLYFLRTPAADVIRHGNIPVLASGPDVIPKVQVPDDKVQKIEQAEPLINSNGQEMGKELAKTDIKRSASMDAMNEKIGMETPVNVVDDTSSTNEKDILEDHTTSKKNDALKRDKDVVEDSFVKSSHRPSSRDKLHIPTEKAVAKKNGWSTSLSVGNAGGASSEVNANASPYMSRVNMAAASNGLLNIPNDKTVVFENGVPYLYQANQLVDIKHHQPITFGISVRKSLKKGFSVETGLTYTLLSSDATLADGELNVKQKLHYIGIPLKANWNFIDKKLFSLYVTGGGAIEKCVYGKLGSEKETVKPLQFSVSGGVGAQINATKNIGFYVEPGVAYFFDDGSDVQTIRKENPFNFNIQAGIRLSY